MTGLKTKENNTSVSAFIRSVDKSKQEDSKKLIKIFQDATGEKPKMWGKSIIGFGKYHYKSSRSKQEGDWFISGFSPRKQAFSLYIMSGFDNYKDILKDLGEHKLSSGCCLYIKKLDDIKIPTLKKLIKKSMKDTKNLKGMC